MFCSHCGQTLLPGAHFCGSCGHPVAAGGLNEFLQGFVHVSLKEIVLFDKIAGSQILRSPVFLFLCLFALSPLAILVFRTNDSILNGLAVWSGVFWALLLFRLFAARELHFGFAVLMVFVTAFLVFPVFDVYLALPPHFTEWLITRNWLPVRFFGFVFGVGIREEMCKALPLLILALFSARMKNPLNGIVLGMMSGIGFAISENVYYVYKVHGDVLADFLKNAQQSGTIKPESFDAFVIPVFNNTIRMMTGPFGHGVYSGIFGYFIALAAADRARRVPFFLAGLGLSSFLHGTYDTFGSPIVGVLIKAFNFFLLMTYILKARGLASARDLGGGMFQRTVIGRVPEGLLAAAPPIALANPAPAALEPSPAAAPAPVAGWRLRGAGGAVAGRTFPLEVEVRVGRDAAQCGIHLEETVVSRRHAVLSPDPAGGWRIRRLSTTGPVYVNGQAVDDVRLQAGDQLQVGTAVFLVEGA